MIAIKSVLKHLVNTKFVGKLFDSNRIQTNSKDGFVCLFDCKNSNSKIIKIDVNHNTVDVKFLNQNQEEITVKKRLHGIKPEKLLSVLVSECKPTIHCEKIRTKLKELKIQ